MLTMLVLMVGQSQSSPLHQSELILAEPSVHCSLEYSTTWVTDYKEVETEECETEYSSLCVTETNVVCVDSVITQCDTVFNNKCHTEYNTVCTEAFRPELEPFIETECEVKYSEECDYRWEGEGNDKVWVPIPGTCKQEPYEECVDVAKTKERQIAYPVCQDVPNQVCVDVPAEVCHNIPQQKCAQKPFEVCKDVPNEVCHQVHKKTPVRVSKKIPKQLCVHTDGYGKNQPVTAPLIPFQPQLVAVPANPVVPLLQHQPLLPLATVRTAKSANITEEHSFLLTEDDIQQHLNSTERVEETREENAGE